VDASGVVEQEVRELVRRRGLDPASDVAAVRALVDDVICDYDDRTIDGLLPSLVDANAVARQVFDAVAGFGPLQAYLDDTEVEEIWINDRPMGNFLPVCKGRGGVVWWARSSTATY
jgi:pilus assembly protein CpaF